jgi:hypothetical protein
MASPKLKEAVHIVVQSCANPARLGATRLNKILWFADCASYRQHGQSITGETYVKRQYGPVPRSILEAISELRQEGLISVREEPSFNGGFMRQFFSLSPVNMKQISEADRAVLEAFASVICDDFTAAEISDASHDQIWEAAELGEEIPMRATLAAKPGEITDEVRNWADSVLAG